MSRNTDTRLQAMLDKFEIYELLAQYCRALDRCDWDLLRSLFHDDATDRHGEKGHVSPDDFVQMARTFVESIGSTAHYLSFPLVEIDGDNAWAETYAIAWHRLKQGGQDYDSVFGARVLDHLQKRDSVWKILERQVVYDWNRDTPSRETWARGAFGEGMTSTGRKGPADPLYAFLVRK